MYSKYFDIAEPGTPHFVFTGMKIKPLNLWCAYPDDLLTEGVAERCAALLTEEERALVARFKFERHQREALTTRALVRTALSRYRSIAPEDWRFTANAQGKPEMEPECGLRFNLSNSLGLVVCLVAEDADVGVDVESRERAGEILKLAPEVFSARERAQLESLPEADKLGRALSLWTLKEAYIKARGLGLALALDKFSFLLGTDGVRLEMDPGLEDEAGRWRFCLLDWAGHRIAAVVERAVAGDLDVWEARPVVAEPVRVDVGAVEWFPRG
jgi:4'-phosphopantetheinyl transferase